ncbi:MAG TPA: rhodanese-like domain-containing protein [Acidimicrobiales bacterium]
MGEVVDGVEQVGPTEADTLLQRGAFLLDVREPDEWTAGHAPGATHIPLASLAAQHAGVLPRDTKIVAVCRVGGRSQRAAQALQRWGYDAVNLNGGMQAWAGSARPVVTDDGAPGQVI